jgi:predicted PurR-regulated permease PerM
MLKAACYTVVPASRRDRVRTLTEAILAQTSAYVAGAFGVALTAGVCTTIFLTIVGLGEYAVALGVVVALLDFIPMIGATIGAVIVCLIAFATSPGIGIACTIFFLIYQQVENYVVYPRIMARSMSIPGVVTIVAVLLGGSLLGVVGALLAIPIAAAILFLLREVVVPRQQRA